MSNTANRMAALMALALPAAAPLAVQAQPAGPALVGAPEGEVTPPPELAQGGAANAGPPDSAHAKECYAKVKFGAQFGSAPPSGPQFSWRQAPGPPGSPGPIWCLIAEPSAPGQILISPEHYGWIRVLCDTEATPARIEGVQRQLSAAGAYQGPIDGRYDANTTAAIQRFQAQRHIEHRGYLSYPTLTALNAYSQTSFSASYSANGCSPQRCGQTGYGQALAGAYAAYPYPYAYAYAYPQYAYPPAFAYGYWPLTTFDTGVLSWPGKR